jgi:hypothetical protein
MRKYSEVEIKKMLEFLINNVYVLIGGQVLIKYVGISMGTNCGSSIVYGYVVPCGGFIF